MMSVKDRHIRSPAISTALAVVYLLCAGVAARADVILDETDLVAAPGSAQGSEFSFTATTAQALVVTLTDDLEPAAFQSLQIAVTLGDALVGSGTVDPTTHVATVAVPAATGIYEFHVIGTPTNLGFGSFGSFSVCTAPQATPTACIAADSYSDNIQTPAVASATGQSTLNTSFTSTVAGTYSVTLIDDAFPVALASAVAGITQGSTPIAGPITPSSTPTQVTLAAGTTYTLLVLATADSTVLAGLYGIEITDPTGATIFTRTLPVGELPSSTIVSNPAAQSLTLGLTDLKYPGALASLGVAVTSDATVVGKLTASGSQSLTAPSGNLEVWQYAIAGSGPGAYQLSLAGGSASLFATTQVVNVANTSAATSFAFAVALASAGTYNFTLADFQFPATLQTLSATVAQNGAVLPTNSSGDFAAAAGEIIVLVNATAPQGTIGIFGVTVATTGGSPTSLLDQTQVVGGAFSARTVTFGSAGEYDVTLSDLGFPAAFADLAVLVSQGSKALSSVYGQGHFQIPVTAGNYQFTFVTTPSAANYGLYAIHVSSAAPTVSLTASASAVVAGQSVQLSWSTTNATACTASGASGWAGSEPTSGSGVAVAIDANVTLTLTCTGPGGSANQSVTVGVTPAPKSGGGGLFEPATLAVLSTLLATRVWRRRRPANRAADRAGPHICAS
jgi:hypothetical protein